LQPVHFIGVGVALGLLCVSIYLCVRFAGNVERLLGPSGTQVEMRLFAFAIFCIGVQILWLGLSDLINSLHLH
jgi:multiple antibiotic resistance protein